MLGSWRPQHGPARGLDPGPRPGAGQLAAAGGGGVGAAAAGRGAGVGGRGGGAGGRARGGAGGQRQRLPGHHRGGRRLLGLLHAVPQRARPLQRHGDRHQQLLRLGAQHQEADQPHPGAGRRLLPRPAQHPARGLPPRHRRPQLRRDAGGAVLPAARAAGAPRHVPAGAGHGLPAGEDVQQLAVRVAGLDRARGRSHLGHRLPLRGALLHQAGGPHRGHLLRAGHPHPRQPRPRPRGRGHRAARHSGRALAQRGVLLRDGGAGRGGEQ